MRPTSINLRTSLIVATSLVVAVLSLSGSVALGQTTDDEEDRLKILTDPESVKKKVDKEKARPPLELFRTQVAPFDILPYMKPNHWSSLGVELRSNYEDYEGSLRTSSVPLRGMPQELIYQRDSRMVKTQITKLQFQVMLPTVPRDINIELLRPAAVRLDDAWTANVRQLEAHQMLILFLTKESSDSYSPWNRYQALFPHGLDRADGPRLDKPRYYRLSLPLDNEKPPVASHPLTWTTISHVVWDGLPPENLSPNQQQAMLDWLHWGGQLTLVGGAGSSFALMKDSFLGPYLPADDTGEIALLDETALAPLSQRFRPPFIYSTAREDQDDESQVIYEETASRIRGRYRPAQAILPPPGRPVAFNTLTPKEGTTGLPLDEAGGRLIGVERRVGRGRILMLGFNPTDPSMARWKGLDTFVRRVVLRRPEEGLAARLPWRGTGYAPSRFGPLPAPDLSWVRYASRDIGSEMPRYPSYRPFLSATPRDSQSSDADLSIDDNFDQSTAEPVAEWLDTSRIPRIACLALEEASGIKIPNSRFVLKILVAYIMALIPLNWLLCRYILRRRELAWVLLPVLSIGFAIVVERASAYDLGYNSASDEIDVIEIFNDYPRAHVSRFGSLYSTGRTAFKIAFPNDPTALALPMATGRALRGEDSTTATFESYPSPVLRDYLVQPRSLAMYRAEQMLDLDGPVKFSLENGSRFVTNLANLELRDAVLVDVGTPETYKEIYLGTIAPGMKIEVPKSPVENLKRSEHPVGLDPESFLKPLRTSFESRPENLGEIRLVAWTPKVVPGRLVEPAVDRERGISAVVVHLAMGPPPSPDGPIYDALVKQVKDDSTRPDSPDATKSLTETGSDVGVTKNNPDPLSKMRTPRRR